MRVTELFAAVRAGDEGRVAAMLDADAGLVFAREKGKHGEMLTPLHMAAEMGLLGMCRLLVARGAEVYTNPMNSYAPVMYAAWAKQAEVVKYFLEEIPEKADGTNGLGVMINLAGRMGWTEIVRKHIERDPLAVHQRGWIGDTPLHWASHNNYAEIVTMLLDAGAVIEADEINCYGGKPLHWAAEHAPAATKVLLERGANVNSRVMKPDGDRYGATPLITNATQKDDCAEVTELLLAHGADVGAKDGSGKTALEHAEARGNVRVAAVLRG